MESEPSATARLVAYVVVAVPLLVPTVLACAFLAVAVCLGSEGHPATATSPRRAVCDPPLLGDLVGVWALPLGTALVGLLATAPLAVRVRSTTRAMRVGLLPAVLVLAALALTFVLPRS